MPGMKGPEVLGAIRSNTDYRDIPVLYRTGLDDTDAAELDGEYRADGIVSKSEGKPALKSSSRIIGASDLSELARKLESAGKSKDIAFITGETPGLLEMYRKLGDDILK